MARDNVLVIGYGSPLRGDDAAGPLAARQLAQRGFEAIEAHQLTPELAEKVASIYRTELTATLGSGRIRRGSAGEDFHTLTPLLNVRVERVDAADKMTRVRLKLQSPNGEISWQDI